MKTLRRHRVLINSALACLMAAWQIGQPLKADTINWTAGSGLNFDWADGTNWSSGVPGAGDDAIFGTPVPLATPGITLAAGSLANSLSFLDSYSLTGGDLTLTSGGIHANLGQSVTINSLLSGNAGLTKTGGGSVRFANASNDYTGVTTIANGTIIISNPAALGASLSPVEITDGNTTPSNTSTIGFYGGSLVLDGSSAGFTFARDLNLSGQGPIGGRGATVNSIGNNILSGTVTSSVSSLVPATFRNTRINSINGTLGLSGTVNAQGTSATTFLSFGGINTAGVGNYNLTGVLSGTGSIEKSGAGILHFNPSSTSGFAGTVRISASATGQQSSVRVTQATVGGTSIFGTNTVSGDDPSAIDLNAGVLEFRSEGNLDFNSLPSGKNVYHRASSTVFTGPGVGGDNINGLTSLGTFRVAANTTATFNSRNGYGVTFGGAWTQESSNNNNTVTNNMGGTLTFTGNAWNNSDGSDRTLTISSAGNTVITGSINTSGAGIKTLTKTGGGNLTILGTATTLNGPVNVQGSLTITDFRSVTNNTQSITLGNTTTTVGNLLIGTTAAATALGLETSRPIILNGTTAANSIYANQAGLNPAKLNGAITKPIAGNATFILGGTNTADNIINTGIPSLGTSGVTKVGPGTWVLAGENLYTGTTTIVNGTLKLKANAASSTILAAANDITFGNSNVYAGGAFEFVGQDGVNNVQALDVLTTTSGAGTVRLTPGVGGTASLSFASQATGAAGTVNFVGADFLNNKITITGANGLISRTNYWNGSNFAYRESNVLRAPVYGTDAGFTTSASALTSAANMEITGSFATNTISISTLKIAGSRTLTINPAQTLTLSAGGVLVTGGNALITGGTALALGSQALVVRTNLPGDSLEIQSVVTGTGGLTKGGEGTLILAAANNQTGTVTINEGTIQLSGSGRLGAAAALTMRQGTILDLNGVTPSTNTNAYNNNGSVTSSAPATFTVGGADGTGTSFGTVNGAISLTKVGTGAQSWLGSSTYTGVTTIGSTGLVTVNTLANGGLPSGIGQSSNAASNLVFNGSTGGLVYQGNVVNGILNLDSASAATDRLFTLAGTGATLSSTVSNNNAIVWSSTGAIVHAVTGPQSLVFTGTSTGDNTFNPQLTDSGSGANITSVTKTAAGQWNFGNPNNTYTGTTTISNGVLAFNDNGALPANSPLALGTTTTSGILQMSGTFERNIVATPAAGTGTISWIGTTGGGGFAAHASQLVVAIGGTGSPTALTWGSGGFVPSGAALIFNSASALADVEFRNAIDFGAAVRTITVNDNGNTGADYATLTGDLSGAGGGLLKNGAGILRLYGVNSYTGTTEVQAGTLVVTSLGGSTGPATSSVGASGVAMGDSNAIVLGNATTTGGLLQYVGPGETSDRKIRLRGTTAGNQIHADGSGPLILTNVAHDTVETGSKTLSLRGTNTAGNMITSQLSDNVAGVLSIGVDGSATWILTNGSNNYTGTTTVGSGALGIGHDTALGTGNLIVSNGNLFAFGGDRTIANTLQMNSGTSHGFLGDHSLTFTNAVNLAASTSSSNFTNVSIVPGEAVIFDGGVFADALTATRNWSIEGQGELVINGSFTTSTAFGVNIIKTGNGTLTLGTDGSGSNWNQAGNAVDVDRGVLKFAADNAIPTAASTNGGLTLSPEVLTTDTATVDLNGTTQTVNAITMNTDGVAIIDNTSAMAATLRFGANDTVASIGGGIGTYTVTDSGAGALSLVKLGNTSATIPTGVTLTYQGGTGVEGGTFTIASPVSGTSSLSVINSGSILALTGGITSPSAITSVVVENGGTLSLLDGAGNKLDSLTNLQLGSSGGTMSTLNLNVGDSLVAGDELNTDTLALLTGGTLSLFSGNQITFNLTDIGLSPNQQYVLLDATAIGGGLFGGPLNIGDYILGGTPGGFSFIDLTTNSTTNQIILTTGNLILGTSYWRGLTDSTWNAAANNWSTDKAGTTPALSIPGAGTDVVFAWDNPGSGPLVTTLEQNFKVNSLTFEAGGTTTPSSVTINPGTVATNRIEIAPQMAGDGIEISAGGPAAVTISGPVRLGGTATSQTWTVADAGSVLSLGSLAGERDVTKAGSGKVVLTTAADPTFNGGVTTDFTINAGTLEILDVSALGNPINSNLANVTVNNTGVFFYNGAASTATNLAMPITLNGGTLSAGNAPAPTTTITQNYSGPVNVSGNSFINMANSNGPATNTAQNITLSGVVSGSGGLTVSSNTTTLTGGNPESGTLLISNAASTWSGPLTLTSGTVDIGVAASPTVVPSSVTFDAFGRLIVRGVNGQTYDLAGAMNFTAGTIGEYLLDNTSAVLAADFVVNQDGQVNLGSGGTGASARFTVNDAATLLNINGNVVLGGNSSISVDGGDADSFVTISGVISDGGSGYSLAINDDAGGWAITNDIIRLAGLNTFTGNISLDSGILEFNTVTGISGGASSLGNGTAILTTNAANLRFIGSSAQSTNRPINTAGGALTLSANGATAADTITYNGLITVGSTADGSQIVLTGAAGREGIITGGIMQTGDAADFTVNGGLWTLQTGTSRIGDDATVTGAGTVLDVDSGVLQVRDDFTVTANGVLNLNAAGVLTFNIATLSADASLRATNGGVINLGASNAVVTTEFDGLRIGTDAAGIGTLNMNAFNQSVTEFILGNRQSDRSGIVNGTGVLTVTGNLDVYGGSINANLASTGTNTFEKISLNTVTLSGDNTGLASTGASIVYEGTLILDYTSSNTTKLRAASALDIRGGHLQLNGNASAATSQSVGSITLASGIGNSLITLNPGTGQDLVLNLGAITRAVNARAGTLRVILPSGTQSATNGVTTTTGLTNGLVGTAGYLTVEDGTGTWFATKSGNNIVALASTAKNDISTWAAGDHITDETTGFTGTFASVSINSLRFDAAGGSDINLGGTGVLGIATGGLLVTDNVGGTPSLIGGTIFSGALASNVPELILTHDGSTNFILGSDLRTNTAFVKSGAGTAVLSGNNVSTGDVSVQNGILQLSGGNAIGDTARVTLANHRNTVLELLASETIGRLEGGQRQTNGDWGVVDVGSHTLTVNQTANSTYSGRFAGTGTVIKSGASIMTFAGHDAANGFTGTFSVAQGLVVLSGAGSQLNGASDIVLSGSGSSLRFDNDQTTAVGSRITDIATITLSSTAGTTADSLGFYMRRTAGTTTGTETVGQLVLNTGHNTIAADGTATDRIARINFVNAVPLVRNNLSTLLLVARNFAATAGQRGRISFSVAPSGAIGGGGAAGTSTLNIYPYMVGEDASGAPSGAANFGNTFVYYETGTTDMRPLNLTTEYVVGEASFNSLGAGVLANNVRFTASPGAALDSDTTGVNALVLDNATGITIGGAAQPLQITSGAILSAGAGANVINGFTSLTTGAGNPYYIYVTNPAGTLTLAATTLGSSEALVKSGAGALILGAANSVTSVNINQGVLEIGDLDHIGGDAGDLRFAGGTLRLGAGFTDDISTRAISFLIGGGTLDTNGIDLTLAGSLGSGAGGFTKAGAGNLTLNGTATYTGNSLLSLGTVTIGANNALGNGGNLTLAAGATLSFSGSQSLSHGLVTTSGASPAIIGSGTITASRGFLFNNTGDIAISAVLAGAGGVFKAQTNMLTLAGLNTYVGTTEVQAGTLSFDSIGNVGGGASALGNPATAQAGIIRMGLTTAATTLTYTGSGHSSNRLIGMQGTTGGVTLNADGSGAISYGGARFENAGNKNLTLGGAADSALINSIGGLSELGGVMSLIKTGGSTWQLSAANNHSGATTVSEGILSITNSGALGTTAAGTSVGTGGVLQVSNNVSVTGEALTLTSGAGGSATLSNLSDSNTWTGNLTVDTGADASNRAVLNSDAGNLLISGSINLSSGTQDFVLRGDGNGEISGQITGSQRLFKSSVGAGTWTLSGDNSSTFTGRATVGNGALQVSSEANLGATPGSFEANQLTLGGGSANGALKTTATMSLSANRGVTLGTMGGTFDTAAATTLTVNSVIASAAGALVKIGTGTLSLAGNNTYVGGTTVSVGTLLAVNTLGSATGAGPVTVDSGATLGGNGFIAPGVDGNITVNGTLQVGAAGDASAQQLTITTTGVGLVTVNNIVVFDLFSGQGSGVLNDATHNDQLVVNGSNGFAIGAGAQLHVSTSLPIDGTWVAGSSWRLFDWSGLTGGVTGEFSNLSDPAPFNYMNLPDLSSIGLAWEYSAGTLTVVVPEPGRMLLLFLGLMGLFFRRRR